MEPVTKETHACDYCGREGEWDFGFGTLHRIYQVGGTDAYTCLDVHACRHNLLAKVRAMQPVVEAACAVRDTCTADDPHDHWTAISRINTVVNKYREDQA